MLLTKPLCRYGADWLQMWGANPEITEPDRSVAYMVCSLVLKYLQPGTKISGRPGLGNCELDINELGVTSQHVNEPSDWQLSKLYVWSTHLTGADVC